MTTQTFVYRAKFEPGERRGIVVSFPDVPEAITQGRTPADALAQAEDALGLALAVLSRAWVCPCRRPKARGASLDSGRGQSRRWQLKLALLDVLRERHISKSAFARLIDKDEKEVRRILDPYHSTKMSTLDSALRALNRRMVIAIQETHVIRGGHAHYAVQCLTTSALTEPPDSTHESQRPLLRLPELRWSAWALAGRVRCLRRMEHAHRGSRRARRGRAAHARAKGARFTLTAGRRNAQRAAPPPAWRVRPRHRRRPRAWLGAAARRRSRASANRRC